MKTTKFSLKKLNLNEAMSEETACFSADLYENGKLIAHISNRGQGGSNDIVPAKGLAYKDVAHIDNIDTECEILTLVEEMNIVQNLQRNSLVLKKDNKIYIQKYKDSFAQMKKIFNEAKFKKLIGEAVKKQEENGYEVLNTNLGL